MSEDPRDPYPWFTRACRDHFGFLAAERGYTATLHRKGLHCRAEYSRGRMRVRLDYEPGYLPDLLIERQRDRAPAEQWHLRDLWQALGERPPYEQAPAHNGLRKLFETPDADTIKAYVRERYETLHAEMDEALRLRARILRNALDARAADPEIARSCCTRPGESPP